jgi:hypothetical protein
MKPILILITGIFACLLFLPVSGLGQCSLSFTYSVSESRCKSTGAIHVVVDGGSGNYNFKLSGGGIPSINTSASDITGIPAGTYHLDVKDVVDGCIVSQDNIVVPGNYQDPRFQLSATDVTCIGASDGFISVVDQQYGTAPFNYSIVAPSASGVGTTNTSGVFTNLLPGSYSIRLSDSCGGLQTRVITIADYNWWIDAKTVSKSGCDSADISITVEDNHGNFNTSGTAFSGFTYGVSRGAGDTTWSAMRSFRVFKGHLRALTLIARDACGHTQTTTWNETAIPKVAASVTINNYLCSGFTATVTGQANLTSPQYCLYDNLDVQVSCNSTGVFSNLPYGSYCIKVTDDCYDTTISRCFTVAQPVPNVAASVSTGSYDCSTFTATVTGQTNLNSPQYCIYDESDNEISCNTDGVFTGLPYGSYCIKITDGCTGTVITRCFTRKKPIPSVAANISVSNRDCSTFTASIGGQSNLDNPQFCLYDNLGTLIGCNSNGTFTGLPYGDYCMHIKNNTTCYDTTIIRCFTVSHSLPSVAATVKITSKNCTSFTASITAQTNLDDPQFCLYDASNTQIDCNSTGVFTGLAYGSYTIRTTNNMACYDTTIVRNFTVTQPVPAVGASVSISNRACSTFTAKVTGQSNLTSPTYYLYDNLGNEVDFNSNGTFNNLPYGTYSIHIVNTCYDTTIVRNFSASTTVMNPHVTAAASCVIGATDLSAGWTGTVAPYTITVYNPGNMVVHTTTAIGGTSATVSGLPGLPAGLQYRVEVRDNCGATASVMVTPLASWLNKSVNANSKCPGGEWQNGSGDLSVSCSYSQGSVTPKIIRKDGAAASITFNTVSGSNFTFNELEPAEYVIEYTLQNCSTKVYDTFQLASYSFPSLQQSAVYQCNDNNFSVSSAVNGGLAPFTYEIIGSLPDSPSIVASPQPSPVFSISNNNTYGLVRLRCIDACGNATTNDASVLPLANTTISASSNCFYNDITLNVDTIPNATYTWYRKTSETDSVLVGNTQAYNIPYLLPTDTGVYICVVSVNSGCLTRQSTFNVNGLCSWNLADNPIGFTGVLKGNASVLSWVVHTDMGADAFEVQWSSDGVHFNKVGTVEAAMGGGAKQQYQYSHYGVIDGPNYYRLKVITRSKPAVLSNVVVLTRVAGHAIRVYPNPAEHYFDVQFRHIQTGSHRLSLIAADGRVVWQTQAFVRDGETRRILRPAAAGAGSYLLVIQNTATGERKVIGLIFR